MTGGKTDRGLEEDGEVIVSRTVEWRRSGDFGNRLATRPMVGPFVGSAFTEDYQREEGIDFFGSLTPPACHFCGRFIGERTRVPPSPPTFAFWSVVNAAVFCSSKLHDSTTTIEEGASMREKLRSGILVRAVGLFCVATASPTREGMIYRRRGSIRKGERGKAD